MALRLHNNIKKERGVNMCFDFWGLQIPVIFKYLIYLLLFLILVSLLELPDWISRKLNGTSPKDLNKKVKEMETRINELEEKVKQLEEK
ncbi:MAG: hypothetical protein KA886_03190 [Candidatus Cloacimonetes bacterium]|nr:hypothetical protein [Candidatus Cloacimonadota bacterium]